MRHTVTHVLCDHCGQRAEPHVTVNAVTGHDPATGAFSSDAVDLCHPCAAILLPAAVRVMDYRDAADWIDRATPARDRCRKEKT